MSKTPSVGSRVGQYRVTREIGHGGMGIVYEAVHDKIGRCAAIKVLLPHCADDPRYLRRFLAEARAISRVRHPGLVQIYDFGQTALGAPYILMELLHGETLSGRLKRRGREGAPPVAEACRIIRQIAATLIATHNEGIIHRDLKPDNVMIVADGEAPGGERVKLLDFGIARFVGAQDATLTAPGIALGTVTYMSPEQCAGDPDVDVAADVYSLGVMLHEALAGVPPFTGTSGSDVMRAHLLMEPPSLPETVPPALARLVARMLAKEPTLRPSMHAVVEVLASPRSSTVRSDRSSGELTATEDRDVLPKTQRSSPTRATRRSKLPAMKSGGITAFCLLSTLLLRQGARRDMMANDVLSASVRPPSAEVAGEKKANTAAPAGTEATAGPDWQPEASKTHAPSKNVTPSKKPQVQRAPQTARPRADTRSFDRELSQSSTPPSERHADPPIMDYDDSNKAPANRGEIEEVVPPYEQLGPDDAK